MEFKKVLFPVRPAKLDCNVVYSCRGAPESSHATAHAITPNITAQDLELLFHPVKIEKKADKETQKNKPASCFEVITSF